MDQPRHVSGRGSQVRMVIGIAMEISSLISESRVPPSVLQSKLLVL